MTQPAFMHLLGRGCLTVMFVVSAALLLVDLAPVAWARFRACFGACEPRPIILESTKERR